MHERRVVEAIVDVLEAGGVRHVFGIPGIHTLALYDALAERPGIRHILPRHEQGAAFAADGYARITRRHGVVSTTTGPGTFNTLSALAEAWSDSSPVILLGGQIDSALLGLGKGILHETVDQGRSFEAVTAFVGRPRSGAGDPRGRCRGPSVRDDRTEPAGVRGAADGSARPATSGSHTGRDAARTRRGRRVRGRRRGATPRRCSAAAARAGPGRPPRGRRRGAPPARPTSGCAGPHADHGHRDGRRRRPALGGAHGSAARRPRSRCSRRPMRSSSSACDSTTWRPDAGRCRSGT